MEADNNVNLDIGNTYFDVFIALSVVFSFYLSQYTSFVPGITLGELTLILSVVLLMVLNNGRFYISNTLIFVRYYAVALICSVISLIITRNTFFFASIGEVITRWIRYASYVLFYVAFCDGFLNKKRIVKIYKGVCLTIAIYAIFQYLLYTLFQLYLPVNILPFNMSRDVSTETLISVAQSSFMRAKGVFVEPGYLAQFLLPGIILSFCGWDKFNNDYIDWMSVITISVAILMSGSVQGLIVLAISFVAEGLMQRRITIKHLLYIIVEIACVIIIYVIIQKTGFMAKPLNRIINLMQGKNMDRSTQLRVYRGFAYWWQLPLEQKIFGVGMGNAANYAFDHQIYTAFDYYKRAENTLGYMSGVSSILVTHGIFCAVIFIKIIVSFFRKLNRNGYLIYMQYVFLLFGGGVFFSILGVLYITLAFADSNNEPEVFAGV